MADFRINEHLAPQHSQLDGIGPNDHHDKFTAADHANVDHTGLTGIPDDAHIENVATNVVNNVAPSIQYSVPDAPVNWHQFNDLDPDHYRRFSLVENGNAMWDTVTDVTAPYSIATKFLGVSAIKGITSINYYHPEAAVPLSRLTNALIPLDIQHPTLVWFMFDSFMVRGRADSYSYFPTYTVITNVGQNGYANIGGWDSGAQVPTTGNGPATFLLYNANELTDVTYDDISNRYHSRIAHIPLSSVLMYQTSDGHFLYHVPYAVMILNGTATDVNSGDYGEINSINGISYAPGQISFLISNTHRGFCASYTNTYSYDITMLTTVDTITRTIPYSSDVQLSDVGDFSQASLFVDLYVEP